jgi:hypothetical protein
VLTARARSPRVPGNRHDLFNTLIWLAFPRSKAAINRRHHDSLVLARTAGSTGRGTLRDALTQFDECGVVVAGTAPDLWRALGEHRWREVFVERRDELLHSTRFIVFGHASHDALAMPFIGLCGKGVVHRSRFGVAGSARRPPPWACSTRGSRNSWPTATIRRATGSPCPCLEFPAPRRITNSRITTTTRASSARRVECSPGSSPGNR